mgnify:CR=1 FL=1
MAGAGVPHSAAIVGAGAVGTTLGGRLLEAGWEVRYASRDPQHSRKLRDALRRQPGASGGGIAEAVQWAGGGGAQGAVLLTVPGSALASDAACAELAAGLGPAAAGATVIDATNPLDRHGNELCWARGRSSAEALQEALPGELVGGGATAARRRDGWLGGIENGVCTAAAAHAVWKPYTCVPTPTPAQAASCTRL